jgi:hypothetical protein
MADEPVIFRTINGHKHVIINWMCRDRDTATLITRPLDEQEMKLYQDASSDGEDDRKIYDKLFPELPTRRAKLKDMSKQQICDAIRRKLNLELQSLDRMTRADLLDMAVHLFRPRKVSRASK